MGLLLIIGPIMYVMLLPAKIIGYVSPALAKAYFESLTKLLGD